MLLSKNFKILCNIRFPKLFANFLTPIADPDLKLNVGMKRNFSKSVSVRSFEMPFWASIKSLKRCRSSFNSHSFIHKVDWGSAQWIRNQIFLFKNPIYNVVVGRPQNMKKKISLVFQNKLEIISNFLSLFRKPELYSNCHFIQILNLIQKSMSIISIQKFNFYSKIVFNSKIPLDTRNKERNKTYLCRLSCG